MARNYLKTENDYIKFPSMIWKIKALCRNNYIIISLAFYNFQPLDIYFVLRRSLTSSQPIKSQIII